MDSVVDKIMMHAFTTDEDGDEHYADGDPPNARWTAYARTYPDQAGMFSSVWEEDFENYDDARRGAEAFADSINLDHKDIWEY